MIKDKPIQSLLLIFVFIFFIIQCSTSLVFLQVSVVTRVVSRVLLQERIHLQLLAEIRQVDRIGVSQTYLNTAGICIMLLDDCLGQIPGVMGIMEGGDFGHPAALDNEIVKDCFLKVAEAIA